MPNPNPNPNPNRNPNPNPNPNPNQADNLIGREQNHKLGTFLVIEQHEPAEAEQMTATCTSNGATSSDCEVGSFAPVVPST